MGKGLIVFSLGNPFGLPKFCASKSPYRAFLYVFAVLKRELERIDSLEFIFPAPTSIPMNIPREVSE
jgi:hypothetical protein